MTDMISHHLPFWRRVALSSFVASFAFALAGCFPQTADQLWKEATDAFEKRDFDRADKAMEQLGKLHAPDGTEIMMLAQIAIARNESDKAIALLAKVPDDNSMASQARLQQGQIELRRSRVPKAESYFKEAIRLNPDKIVAHRELIYIYGMQLRRAELAAEFQQLARLEPLNFDQVWLWCMTRGTAWEPKEIVVEMAKYVDADPSDRYSRLSLADANRALGNFDAAFKALEPLSDDDPGAREERVKLALDRGEDEEAIKLLDGGPKNHLGLALLRGRMAMARGDANKAVEYFREALKAEPNNRDALFGIAHSLQKLNSPEAKKYLDESNRMERLGTLVQRASMPSVKGTPQATRELAEACEAAGRYPEARAWYSILLRANPIDSELQQAIFQLKAKEAETKPEAK